MRLANFFDTNGSAADGLRRGLPGPASGTCTACSDASTCTSGTCDSGMLSRWRRLHDCACVGVERHLHGGVLRRQHVHSADVLGESFFDTNGSAADGCEEGCPALASGTCTACSDASTCTSGTCDSGVAATSDLGNACVSCSSLFAPNCEACTETECTACSGSSTCAACDSGMSTTLALGMHRALRAGVEWHMHGLLGLEHVHERYVRQACLQLRPWWLHRALRCRCWMAHARPARTRARARALRTAGTSTTLALVVAPVLFGAGVGWHMHGLLGLEHVHERYVRGQWLLLGPVHRHVRYLLCCVASNGTCTACTAACSTASISSSARAPRRTANITSTLPLAFALALVCDSGSAFDFDFGVCVSCPSLDNGTCLDCIGPTIQERGLRRRLRVPKVGEWGQGNSRADSKGTPPNGT